MNVPDESNESREAGLMGKWNCTSLSGLRRVAEVVFNLMSRAGLSLSLTLWEGMGRILKNQVGSWRLGKSLSPLDSWDGGLTAVNPTQK
jgi:hypothetical protein